MERLGRTLACRNGTDGAIRVMDQTPSRTDGAIVGKTDSSDPFTHKLKQALSSGGSEEAIL
jgi:hypothetical protein